MPKRLAVALVCAFLMCGGCARRRPIYEIPMTDVSRQERLLRGFYEIAEGARWTSRAFAVSLDVPSWERATYLELDFNVSWDLVNDFRTATLLARVNGVEVGRQAIYAPGRYTLTRFVPVTALKKRPAVVEFELDKSTTDARTGRTLGVNARLVGFKEYEQTAEYRETQMWIAREGFRKAGVEKRAQVPPAKEQELVKLFAQAPGWKSLSFHGVPVAKNPLDLWMLQQILYEVQPEVVIETGTSSGGSALYWANALNALGLERSRVLTVDTQDQAREASQRPLWKKYVEFVQGDSTDPAISAQIAAKARGKRTLVTLDSEHTVEHVLGELRTYAPMVSRGSYLVVGSTHLDGTPAETGTEQGPFEAVRRFLEEGGGKDFEQDASRELMVLTSSPGGWLRRK